MTSFADNMDRHKAVWSGVAVAILSIAVLLIASRGGSPIEVRQTDYFYDLEIHRLFTDDAHKIPPFKTDAGHQAVGVIVYACKGCDDPANRFVGHLEKYDETARQLLASGQPIDPEVMAKGHLVRLVKGSSWTPRTSQAGARIVEAAEQQCTGGELERCYPQKERR